MVKRAEIVAEARSWVGVPFRHQGRSRAEGVDCVGLIVVVARALGLPDLDYPVNYSRSRFGYDLVRHAMQVGRNMRLAQAGDGDVVVFAEANLIPCHTGILVSQRGLRYVVQALGRPGVRRVIEVAYRGEWENKARYAFAFPDVED